MTTILLLLILLVGLSLTAVSDRQAIMELAASVEQFTTYAQLPIDDKQYEHMWMMLTNITSSKRKSNRWIGQTQEREE